MKNLYEKSPLTFTLLWIGLYVVVMNIALQFCGGFDNLTEKTVPQLLAPVICSLALAAAATIWILHNRLGEKFGLCKLKKAPRAFGWFIPLALMSCINLKNGLALPAPLPICLLMAANLAIGGYIEELIFRGFLFRTMEKDGLTSAIIVSAITFGAGHIVNIFNTADIFGVLLQICYAIVIGFLYTIIVYKGGSLLPCIASHMFVNFTSVFAPENGPFSNLVSVLFGSASALLNETCSATLIILISGSYALWLWKKA
jgi:membrane protease YdiL (CAAX protease family)